MKDDGESWDQEEGAISSDAGEEILVCSLTAYIVIFWAEQIIPSFYFWQSIMAPYHRVKSDP